MSDKKRDFSDATDAERDAAFEAAEDVPPVVDPNAPLRRPFAELLVWGIDLVDKPIPPRRALLSLREPLRERGEVLVRPEDLWMPAGLLCVLAAPGGRSKTATLMSLAVHVAAGVPWCGLHVVQPGPVALVFGEEDQGEVHRRMMGAMERMTEEERRRAAGRLALLPLAGTGSNRLVDDAPGGKAAKRNERAAELSAILATEGARVGGWSMVVVDPFSRFAGMAAETDNASATETMTVFEELAALPGKPAVVVAHHSRKGTTEEKQGPEELADMVRGSSAIGAAARWVAYLLRGKDDPERTLKLCVVKSNGTRRDKALALTTEHGVIVAGEVVAAWEKPPRPEKPDAGDGKGKATGRNGKTTATKPPVNDG